MLRMIVEVTAGILPILETQGWGQLTKLVLVPQYELPGIYRGLGMLPPPKKPRHVRLRNAVAEAERFCEIAGSTG